MYKDRSSKSHGLKKSLVVLGSILLLVAIAVGATVAYITTSDGQVENTFNPSQVTTYVEETLTGTVKSNVKICNTGDVSAYIRAAVVVTWQDASGNIYGKKPVEGQDYTITWYTEGWDQGDDGFYYYLDAVQPGAMTEDDLIVRCEPVTGKAPTGYTLAVTILSSGIQSEGEDAKGNKPIELAWGVDIDGGALKAATIVQ